MKEEAMKNHTRFFRCVALPIMVMALLGAVGATAGAVVGEALFLGRGPLRAEPRKICLLFDVSGARAFTERRMADPDGLGIRAMDPHTLVVTLEEPCSYFLHIMAAPETKPLPRHVVERYGPSWADPGKIVTNGPFRLKSLIPGKSVVLERNKD